MKSAKTESRPHVPVCGSIPIVLGVTGHRDIPPADVPVLHAAARDYLTSTMVKGYSDTDIIVLSALAEGADRIVARAAIAAGCRLGVFLPFPADEYERDFETPDSKREFRDLLAVADFVEVAPRLPDAAPGNRDHGYVAVGVAIARHAHCMLAFWDGIADTKPGGTADVVRIYRTGIPMAHPLPEDTFSALTCGPVEHFWTRRVSGTAAITDQKLGTHQFLPPLSFGQTDDVPGLAHRERSRRERIYSCIAQFNLNTRSLSVGENTTAYTQRYLIEDSALAARWPLDDYKAKRLAGLYAAADALSVKAQETRLRYFRWIIGLTLVAIFFEQVYSGPFAIPILLMIAIGWTLAATWLYVRIRQEKLEEKYLDYRTLAEAMRVQFFWHLSGIAESPADHYLRNQRDELEWLSLAVRAANLPTQATCSPPDSGVGIPIAISAWVKGQLTYFLRCSSKQAKLAARITSLSRKWFYTAIAAVLLAAAFHTVANAWVPALHPLTIPIILVVYSMLFAIAGLIKLYGNIMAYQEQSNRYGKMAALFGSCSKLLDGAMASGDLAHAKLLLLMIGRQALNENTEWLMLHRQRPIEVPLGG